MRHKWQRTARAFGLPVLVKSQLLTTRPLSRLVAQRQQAAEYELRLELQCRTSLVDVELTGGQVDIQPANELIVSPDEAEKASTIDLDHQRPFECGMGVSKADEF
ncbi:MAG TPA: hypothetical protein VFL72_00095, partial [Acidimicrobiia bacterium]|nr:hypothetical protein [Acidimicrobiia bacterium]